jgi:MFS family permease
VILIRSLPLRHKPFALLFAASLISRFGDAILGIAALWSVYVFSHSAILLSLIVWAEVSPTVLFAIYSGVIVDRLNHKKIMILADVARFVVLVVLVAAWYLRVYPLVALYASLFILSALTTLFSPGFQLMVKQVVDRSDSLSSNAWLHTGRSIADLLGLTIGGVIVTLVGTNIAFLADGLTFLLSALLLYAIPFSATSKKASERKAFKQELVAAIHYLATAPAGLKQAFWYIVIINFAISPLSILMTLRADRSSSHAVGLGALSASLAVGSLLGSRLADSDWVKEHVRPLVGIPAFIGVFCLFSTLPAVISPLWIDCLLLVGSGIGSSLTLVFVNFLFQQLTDTMFLGRISSFRSLALRVPPPIMAFFYAFLISKSGLGDATVFIEVVTIILAAFVFYRYGGRQHGLSSASN